MTKFMCFFIFFNFLRALHQRITPHIYPRAGVYCLLLSELKGSDRVIAGYFLTLFGAVSVGFVRGYCVCASGELILRCITEI